MTGSKWQWLLKQMTRKLWGRTSLFALLAVVTALISIVLNKFITLPPTINVSNELLNNILNILATSIIDGRQHNAKCSGDFSWLILV